MSVTVMAIFRRIAISSVDIVALAADVILLGQRCKVMGCITVLPGCSGRLLGAGRPEVAYGTLGFKVVAKNAFLGACTMKVLLLFIKPLLTFGMSVAIVTVFRAGSVRTGQLMALDADSVRSGQAEFFMGNGAVLPINSIWDLAARRAKMTGRTLGFQIMAQGTIELTLAMIPHLCSIKPGLAQGMIQCLAVAIMTRLRTIARCPVGFVAGDTDRIEFLQLRMGDAAVNPVCVRWNSATGLVKMAFRATGHCGAANQVGTMTDLAGFRPGFHDLFTMELGRVGGADKFPGMERSGIRSIAVRIGTA